MRMILNKKNKTSAMKDVYKNMNQLENLFIKTLKQIN